MRKGEEDQGTMLLRYGREVLLGGGLALAVSLLLLFLAAVGVSRGLLGAGLREQIAVVACVLGSFGGGLFAVRRCPARGLFVGLAVGAVLFLLQLTLGLLIYDAPSLENGGIGILFSDLCGGAAAGILAGGGKRRAPKKKRRSGR